MHICPDELGPILAFWHHIPDLARLLWYKAMTLPVFVRALTMIALAVLVLMHAGCRAGDVDVVIDDKKVHVDVDTEDQNARVTVLLPRKEYIIVPMPQFIVVWKTPPTAEKPE